MPGTLEFVFDFASPNAYLVWRVLPAVLERSGATLALRPCLLGGLFKATGNQAPIAAFADVPNKLAYERLEMKRFIETHRLTAFRMNPHFPVNTLLLMRGLVAARSKGDAYADAFVDMGLAAMWEEGLKMDDPSVFMTAVTDAGLDGEALLAATREPAVKAELVALTEAAAARGAFGVPTFFVGEQMFFGKERLGQIEDALVG